MSQSLRQLPVFKRRARSFAPTIFLVAALALATVAFSIIGNGNPLVALVPILGFLFVVLLTRTPLRWPALCLIFAGLTLENPGDVPADGLWRSPLYPVGALLLAQLKQTIHVGALVFTGTDVILVLMFAILIHRRVTDSTLDADGAGATPRPMIIAAWATLAGAMFAWAYGMATGGIFRFSLWQLQRIIYLPLCFLLFQAVLPARNLNVWAARMLLTTACIKAALAIYIHHEFPLATYATTHTDSMLFATATVVLLLMLLEKPSRTSMWRLLLIGSLLVTGMVANNRRLVWVEIALACVFVLALTRKNRIKRKFARWALFALPLVPPYLAAGWNSPTGVFAPVKTIRSVLDSKSDGSTEWRDLENYDLFATVKGHPIAGTGFGHPYDTPITLPDVASVYELEPYCPHNSVLGIWAYTGIIGFSAIWTVIGVAIFFAGRAARFATEPNDRIAALGSLAVFVIYMLHCYGDLGLGTWTSVLLVSFAMVVVAKLSTRVGAWPTTRSKVKTTQLRRYEAARPSESRST